MATTSEDPQTIFDNALFLFRSQQFIEQVKTMQRERQQQQQQNDENCSNGNGGQQIGNGKIGLYPQMKDLISFARNHLAVYQSSKRFKESVQKVVGLLAFPSHDSVPPSLSFLLSQQQRQNASDAINKALLVHSHSPSSSALQRLLQQLMQTHHSSRLSCGNAGEIFCLSDH